MGRERITLITEAEATKVNYRKQIESGEMNPEEYNALSKEEQLIVTDVLFEMSSEKISPNQGTSALEFILFAFIRITNKKISGISLSPEDIEIEEQLKRITMNHQITSDNVSKNEWLFDYLSYAEYKSAQFLENRKEHIARKISAIGEV